MRTGVRENSERTERETYSSVDTLTIATHDKGGKVATAAAADGDGDDNDDEDDDGHTEHELQM